MASDTVIPSAMIETNGLRRTFNTRGGAVEAVKGVDLRVGAGEIFGSSGPTARARPPRCGCLPR